MLIRTGAGLRGALLRATVACTVTAAVMLAASPAAAATGETVLCHQSDYSCLSGTGYAGQSEWGSWGPGHNCVSYASYRLIQNGASKPWGGLIGNADEWDDNATAAGIPVDLNPTVGSIAQWDTGPSGHLAYVEAVTSAYIEVSEDAYISDTSGYSSRRRLDRSGTTFQSAEFLHIADVRSDPKFEVFAGDFNGDDVDDVGLRRVAEGVLYMKYSDGNGGFTSQTTYTWAGGTDFQPFTGDFNGDGVDDVGLRKISTGVLYMKYSDGNGGFTSQTTYAWAAG